MHQKLSSSKGFTRRSFNRKFITGIDLPRSIATFLFNRITLKNRIFPKKLITMHSTNTIFKAKFKAYNDFAKTMGSNMITKTYSSTCSMLPTGYAVIDTPFIKAGTRASVFEERTSGYLIFYEPELLSDSIIFYKIGYWKLFGRMIWIQKSTFIVDRPIILRYSPNTMRLSVIGRTFNFNHNGRVISNSF